MESFTDAFLRACKLLIESKTGHNVAEVVGLEEDAEEAGGPCPTCWYMADVLRFKYRCLGETQIREWVYEDTLAGMVRGLTGFDV